MWILAIFLSLFHFTFAAVEVTPIPGTPPLLPGSIFCSEDGYDVYYVDYLANGTQPSIFRYSIKQNKIYGAFLEGYFELSYLVPIEKCSECKNKKKNLFMVGSEKKNLIISWDGVSPVAEFVQTLFTLEPDIADSQTDVGVQNRYGELFVGTTKHAYCAAAPTSSLYTYSKRSGVTKVFSNFTATTGITYGGDGTIYHVDICTGVITALKRNTFGKYVGSVAFDFKTIVGPRLLPCFIDIDTAGYLYVPAFRNSTIYKVNPSTSTANPLLTLPNPGVEGAAFCGPKRDTLFIVMAEALIVDPLTFIIYQKSVPPPPPLYKVTGLGSKGTVSSGLII